MKKKQSISILPFLIMGVFFGFTSSCEKDDDNNPSSNNPANGQTTAVFNPSITYGTMTDQDGNVYKTVTIGTQTWMAENLRTTKYNDGTTIPNITDSYEWGGLSTGAYCNYNNTSSTDTIITYGRLYNWYTIKTGKLAPKGWHIPSYEEWSQLCAYLGGESVAGGKLKEIGATHWYSSNASVINETGFTALPGGTRTYGGSFYDIGRYGCWWSARDGDATRAFYIYMDYRYTFANILFGNKGTGLSVRCVKD